MKLQKLIVQGFRCYKERTEIPFHQMTVLIGENDSGKSSIFRLLDFLINKTTPFLEEYCKIGSFSSEEISVIGIFSSEQIPNQIAGYFIDNTLELKKTFYKNESPTKIQIRYDKLNDEELINYQSLQATAMQALLQRYNLPDAQNQSLRKEILAQYLLDNYQSLPKIRDYFDVNINEVFQYLPLLETYSSSEYGNPKNLIYKTLNSIYRTQFYNEEGELKNKSFSGLKAKLESRLNDQIQKKLLENIQKYNSNVINVKGEFTIDFARGFSLNDISLDEGQGYKLIENKGEGSKKRLFLSILEWDKQVQSDLNSQFVIRAYDEPDTNLHFEAQRKMFYAIKSTSDANDSKIQNLIATHSLSMIDRAPMYCINHLKIKDGVSRIEFLNSQQDADVKKFLEEISELSGLKNSSIFYEKCFLIVEGDSEENAIPHMYKTYYGKSLIEDGIVLINIESNGAWKAFLKMLSQNKKDITLILLDSDTQNVNSGAKITPQKLTEIGFPATFLSQNIFFVGQQEFEDTFPDKKIRILFNTMYPKPNNKKWTKNEIIQMRANFPKLSHGFEHSAKQYISNHHRRYRKPEFALELARLLNKNDLISITALMNLFNRIQGIVNG